MKCTFCDKNFHFTPEQQLQYEMHTVTCGFLHSTQQQEHQQPPTIDDPPPTPKDMYRIIQYLMYENKQLRQEMTLLKTRRTIRHKPTAFQAPPPPVTFPNWIKGFQIEYRHLERVFQRDLYDGIKLAILDRIKDETWENLPIKIHQSPRYKRPQIYVYDTTLGWILCDPRYLNLLMETVTLNLQYRFFEWDAQFVPTTPEEKEEYNINLLKIEGAEFRKHIDQHRTDLRVALIRDATSIP
jgi:hypothetical protein